jgi:lysine decarboxylase
MLRAAGVKKLLFPVCSHKSVYNGCRLSGIVPVTLENRYIGSVPQQPTAEEIEEALVKNGCDGVLLTSPDYYGNIADYRGIQAVCLGHGVPLLCDGAHGAHLHGTERYAGKYCDLWVDGVHKNLPAFTQGAVLSAKQPYVERVKEALDIFRTTSPNYMIMASVEYAVKYPRNREIERLAEELKEKIGAYPNDDWSKIVLTYGENARRVSEYLEGRGIYPEFCDGENVMFYLSPATKRRELHRLQKVLEELRPLQRKAGGMPEVKTGERRETRAWVALTESEGRTCAQNAGLFPPCIPLLREGQIVTRKEIEKLQNGKNTYGLNEGKVLVYGER